MAHLWTHVRDDRSWNGVAPPAAIFRFSCERAATKSNPHFIALLRCVSRRDFFVNFRLVALGLLFGVLPFVKSPAFLILEGQANDLGEECCAAIFACPFGGPRQVYDPC